MRRVSRSIDMERLLYDCEVRERNLQQLEGQVAESDLEGQSPPLVQIDMQEEGIVAQVRRVLSAAGRRLALFLRRGYGRLDN